jgi:hypothetical protein
MFVDGQTLLPNIEGALTPRVVTVFTDEGVEEAGEKGHRAQQRWLHAG